MIGLRAKIASVVGVAVSIGVLAYLAVSSTYQWSTLHQALAARVNLAAAMQAQALSVPLWDLNERAVRFTLESMRTDPDFVAAAVFNEHGEVFVEIGDGHSDQKLRKAEYPIFHSVKGEMQRIGSVTVSFSSATVSNEALKQFLFGLLLLTIILASIVVVVLRGLFWLTRPIIQLGEAVRNVGAGVPGASVPIFESRDEVGALARDVSNMVNELNSLNQQLEEKVQKRTEQLAESAHRAEQASKMKSMFLATMSHELRTPLNGIIGMSEILLTSQMKLEQQLYVRMAKESAEGMVSIINDVLDLSQIEAGKLHLEEVQTDIEELVAQVFRSIGVRASIKGLEMGCEMLPARLPLVLIDSLRVRQILVNLIGNAIKFTETGGVIVSVLGQDTGSEDGILRMCVQDTGMGMSKDQAAQLFRPYTQVVPGAASRFGGTGLGLSICRNLVELMEGEISVDTEAGRGTAFHVRLPVRWLKSEALSKGVEPEGPVLLVHGDGISSRSVLNALISYQVGVHSLPDLVSAHERIACRGTRHPLWSCAVISSSAIDATPPQVVRAICQHLEGRVVVTIPSNELMRIDEYLQLGAGEVVARPFVPQEVVRAVQRVQEMRKTEAAKMHDPQQQKPFVASKPLRVLVSDDTQVNRLVTRLFLERSGHSVRTAETGIQTLQEIESSEPFDIVLLDLNLPDLSGFEVARRIRERDRIGQSLPIVAVTADVSKESQERCLAAGMTACLTKPLNRESLLSLVAQLVEQGSREDSHPSTEDTVVEPPATSIDTEDLQQRYDNDWGIISEVFEAFQEEGAAFVSSLKEAARLHDCPQVKRVAHALKSSSGNVSARRVWWWADRLERDAGRLSKEEVVEGVSSLQREWSCALETLVMLLDNRPGVDHDGH